MISQPSSVLHYTILFIGPDYNGSRLHLSILIHGGNLSFKTGLAFQLVSSNTLSATSISIGIIADDSMKN
jgi:hypothetical protein